MVLPKFIVLHWQFSVRTDSLYPLIVQSKRTNGKVQKNYNHFGSCLYYSPLTGDK